MPRFDIPGRTEPTTVNLSWNGKPYSLPLPCDTEDPVAIRLLSRHPGVQEVPTPGPPEPVPEVVPEPEPEPEPFPVKTRPSRKEV